MKKKIFLIFLLIIATITIFIGCSKTSNVDRIVFNDKNLERAIKKEINKPFWRNIYLNDVRELRELKIDSNNITDISELDTLTKLETLHLSCNNITDISPLSNLTKVMTTT